MSTMNDLRTLTSTAVQRVGQLVVGVYAWSTAAYFGCVWLDVLYGRLLTEGGSAPREVADVLLAASAGMVLAGVAAVGLGWYSPSARQFLLASLALTLLMLMAPALLSGIVHGAGNTFGASLRILLAAGVSSLAFIAFGKLEGARWEPPAVQLESEPAGAGSRRSPKE
jgi:hypothetical protein